MLLADQSAHTRQVPMPPMSQTPPLIVNDNRKVEGISGIQCLGPQATPPLYSNPNRRLFPHVYLYFGPTRYLRGLMQPSMREERKYAMLEA